MYIKLLISIILVVFGMGIPMENQNTFQTIHYDKGDLPIRYSDISYLIPVEHAQASEQLANKDGNSYYMFTHSQNYAGLIWVVEVNIKSKLGKVVWWQQLDKCQTPKQCDDELNPGNYNHPARISREGDILMIAFQNYSYNLFDTHTYPIYPKLRSADSIALYNVSNPAKPAFIRRFIGNDHETWGGTAPSKVISEVILEKIEQDQYLMGIHNKYYKIEFPDNITPVTDVVKRANPKINVTNYIIADACNRASNLSHTNLVCHDVNSGNSRFFIKENL